MLPDIRMNLMIGSCVMPLLVGCGGAAIKPTASYSIHANAETSNPVNPLRVADPHDPHDPHHLDLSTQPSDVSPTQAIISSPLRVSSRHDSADPSKIAHHQGTKESDSQLRPEILAYLNGSAIFWDDIRNPLLESQGKAVLNEVVLYRLVGERLRQAGLTIRQADLETEQLLLLTQLTPSPPPPPPPPPGSGSGSGSALSGAGAFGSSSPLDGDSQQAQRLLDEVRRRRGLGDERFRQLLACNAGLRKLVAPQVEASPVAVRQEYDLTFGPRYAARIIVCNAAAEAGRLVARARLGESFGDLAVQASLDASADRGGLLAAISPADTTYPQAVRTVLTQLEPGQVSDPIALENQFAILRLERKIEAQTVPLDDVKEELSRRVRRRVETMLMARLARTMIDQADLIILDPVLKAGG